MGKKGNGQWKVALGRCQVAVFQCFIEEMSYGVHLKVCVFPERKWRVHRAHAIGHR